MELAPNFFDTGTRNWRARLAVSVDIMRELSRYSDPHDMYDVFSRRMGQLFPTDRQVTVSRRGLDAPRFRVTRFNQWAAPADPAATPDRFPVQAGGLFADLLYADEPRVIDDLVLAPGDPAAGFIQGQRSLLAVPVYDNGTAVNVVIVTREEAHAFPPEQVPELVWMTNLFGRATQTLVLSAALKAAYESADAELRAVADLQQGLLPPAPPAVPGLDVAVHYRAAGRAGGDYYDFFPHPDGSLGVLVADVSGHGAHAAVLMAVVHNIAHAAAAPTTRPGEFLGHLNANLAGRYHRVAGSFVTAFYALLDPARGSITYASAGHVPPRLMRADGGLIPLNKAQRLPLGISPPAAVYPESRTDMGPGDHVILFTDGVTEAADRAGDMFGTDRLDIRRAAGPRPAAALLADVLSDLDDFTLSAPAADDRTVVVVRRTA